MAKKPRRVKDRARYLLTARRRVDEDGWFARDHYTDEQLAIFRALEILRMRLGRPVTELEFFRMCKKAGYRK